MTMKQTFNGWTQVTGWGTALASVGSAGVTTSGTIDNSTTKSFAMDVGLFWDKDSATGTGLIELWLLTLLNDGSDQLEDAPALGGQLIGFVTTAAETNQRSKRWRVSDLPEKFAFYLVNNSGIGLGATSDLRYRLIDLVDQ